MQQRLDLPEKRTEKLEVQSKKNSQNSSKPPSSYSPYTKPKKKTKNSKRKRGAQKGHKGYTQQMLEANTIESIIPEGCACGRLVLDPDRIMPFYTYQHIQLPEIKVDVTYYILNQGICKCCGKTVKAKVPGECSSGYGPRQSAVICELFGSHGASRETVQDFASQF